MFMISKCNNPLSPVLVALMILFVASPLVRAEREMTAAEVWALLPKGVDAEDDNEMVNRLKLVEQGEAIHGALLDIVREHNDPLVTGSVLSVLRASKGNSRNANRAAVAEMGRILDEKKSITDEWEAMTLVLMAEAIADMGEADDARLLAPLLDHPSGDVRSAGYSGMEKLAAKALSAGAGVQFLPPYSPDLNPIEKMWGKIKSVLRGIAARTLSALHRAIRKSLRPVTPQDVIAWFSSCGYTIF